VDADSHGDGPEVDIVVPDETADETGVPVDVDLLPEIDILPEVDVPLECPDTKCLIGNVSCPTDGFEQTCIPFDAELCSEVGVWSEAVACAEDATCVTNEGCVCDMGACVIGDTAACVAPQELGICQAWICNDGCCAVEEVEDCCTTASDCDDDDKCTQDLCDLQDHVCMHTDKVDTGLCDDGLCWTVEGCDPETGECTYTVDADACPVVYCFGSSLEQAAANHCGVDPCKVPDCVFDGPFEAWNEVLPPDCEGADAEYCGECDFDTDEDCDDGDPCTEDQCQAGVGCVNTKLDLPGCVCFETSDCEIWIDGPCQEVACDMVEHVCEKFPKDCEDGHECTFDFCDLDTDTCIHQLIEPTPPECEDVELCYDDDFCDGEVEEEFGEDCPCKHSWCEFVTGKDYGLCIVEDVGCDDNDLCTVDTCAFDGESCACAYAPFSCDDEDPCTEDVCDPLVGCLYPDLDVDDGNPCTIDTCDPELTVPVLHTPVICEEKVCMEEGVCNVDTGLCDYIWDSCSDDNPCTVDQCNEANGECLHSPYTSCNDDNLCTIDECDPVNGLPEDNYCEYIDVICDDGNLCTDDVCNEVTGTCMHPPSYCNDQNACTVDGCDPVAGCVATEPLDCTDCIHPLTEEVESCPGGNGSPGFEINSCTLDLCDPFSGCYHVPVVYAPAGCGSCLSDEGELDHEACADGNLCTLDQCICTAWNPLEPSECIEAECLSTPTECECPGECAACACDPFTGECEAVPGDCSDCVDLETGDTIPCPGVVPPGFAKNLCTLDACDMDIGECMHIDVECFDNDFCTEDVCNPVVGCTYPEISCNDEKPCTLDSCEPGTGCIHVEECDDTDLCTIDSCMDVEPFECQFIAADCDDGNPCTEDICNGGGICIFEEVPCDDDDPCTIDACDPDFGDPEDGFCLHAPKLCDDYNPCTVNICHPLNGSCHFPNISCDDCIDPDSGAEEECPGMAPEGFVKNLCTEDFAVQEGDECACTHTEVNPADQDLCTTDYCDPLVGVVNEPMVCEDEDGNPCTVETCNPESGLCSATLVDCEDDGDPCTEDVPEAVEDPELGLICTCASKPLDCDDSDACTIDMQVIEGDFCYCGHEAVVCESDDDPCTTDVCLIDEGCVHVPPECEDGDVCTYDWCDPALAEISEDPDVYCVHDEKTCQDCINPVTLDIIQNCVELPEGYVYNECTQGDYCDLDMGGCQYPQVTYCPPDSDLCTIEYCEPTTGICASDPLDCSDGNVCTVDQCVDGQCVKSDAPGAQCVDPDDCFDGDPCTQDVCATMGDCTCSNPPKDCDDDDCCTVDTCDPDTGDCVQTPVYPGCAVCAEDLDCLVECPTNPFTGEQVAPDDDESGLCDPNTAVIIDDENTVVVFRDACNHWLCNLDGGQGCDEGMGQCMNTAVDCDDDDDCTLDYCDPETGCFTEPNPACCTPETDPPLMEDDPDFDPLLSVCFDYDPCTVDSCDYGTGACQYDDLLCDDGSVCTVDECEPGVGCTFTWQEGCEYVCYNDYDCSAGAGNPGDSMGLCSVDFCTYAVDPLGNCVYDGIICDGGMPCTEGLCDPEGGCSYKPLGAACDAACETDDDCDDGWACSTSTCDDGTCLVSVLACNDEDPCTRDFCDPNYGLCGYAVLDGCDSDDCAALGGDVWCDDGNACTIDWCDTTLHQCMYLLKTCEDGDLCTTDICDPDEGCLFFPMVPCLTCYTNGDCDDDNPCTEDLCKNANPLQETDPGYMNDGNAHPARYCTHRSICAECESQVDCNAYSLAHPCVEDAVCDTDAGMCDIDFAICDDGDPCTANECNPFTGECQYTAVPDCCHVDDDCGPVLPCYVPYCDPASNTCLSLPSLCDDFNPCTADSCDVVLGCVHEPIEECLNECEKPQDCYLMAYGPVSCTIAECVIDGDTEAGTCEGTPLYCNDGNPCTVDVCVPLLGCQYYLEDPQCSFACDADPDCADGSPCTEDSCDPETKMCDYSLVDCDDLNPCTGDWCDPATGECTHQECPECTCDVGCLQNSACDDGDPCTLELCEDGACFHPTLFCWDGDPCTDDTCDPVGGCMFLPIPECAGCTSPVSCDDGNSCTYNDCVNQYCVSEDLCAQ